MKKNLLIFGLLFAVIAGVLWAGVSDGTISLLFLHKPKPQGPVWGFTVTGTWDIDDTNAVTQSIDLNGIIQKVVLTVPDSTNGVAFKVQIFDNESKNIFDSGDQDEDDDYAFSLYEPVSGTISVVLTPAGATGDVTLDAVVTVRGIN